MSMILHPIPAIGVGGGEFYDEQVQDALEYGAKAVSEEHALDTFFTVGALTVDEFVSEYSKSPFDRISLANRVLKLCLKDRYFFGRILVAVETYIHWELDVRQGRRRPSVTDVTRLFARHFEGLDAKQINAMIEKSLPLLPKKLSAEGIRTAAKRERDRRDKIDKRWRVSREILVERVKKLAGEKSPTLEQWIADAWKELRAEACSKGAPRPSTDASQTTAANSVTKVLTS